MDEVYSVDCACVSPKRLNPAHTHTHTHPHTQIFTQHDLERVVGTVEATLGDPKKDWETRVNAVSLPVLQ